MEIALVEGVRSLPNPGAQGQCQACGAPAIAKCGEQIVWHWAHKGRRVCDPWWENEGEWHREWKRSFPVDFHEVVQHDSKGERHIADIKLPSGLVVELQHSNMPLDEMRSREAFYDNMIWIVDAAPFRQNITIFGPLPDPSEPFVADLVFATPLPSWRWNRRVHDNFDSLMFHRRSEAEDGVMSLLHSGRELAQHFPHTYRGHRLYLWMKPREVWLQTRRPTYLDLGEGLLALLTRYGSWEDTFMCIKLLSKQVLVAALLSSGSPL